MNIYRNKKNNELYAVEYISPHKVTGSWYNAIPLYNKEAKKFTQLDEDKIDKLFKKVSYSNKVTRSPNPFKSTF